MSNYSTFSPYKETPINSYYLDLWVPRQLPIDPEDTLLEIPSQFEHRPDLLAYEAYGDARLWWVFAVRNPTVLKDPIYDLVSGVKIYIPKKQTVLNTLGAV
jgi:hypothetical protein